MGNAGDDPDRHLAAADGGSSRQGRGVVIAHPSPSIRMRLALALLDEYPVFLANCAGGMLYHVWLAERGYVAAPCAIVLSPGQLDELSAMPSAWRACGCTKLVVIDVEDRGAEGADAVLASADPGRVIELLDAA